MVLLAAVGWAAASLGFEANLSREFLSAARQKTLGAPAAKVLPGNADIEEWDGTLGCDSPPEPERGTQMGMMMGNHDG